MRYALMVVWCFAASCVVHTYIPAGAYFVCGGATVAIALLICPPER